MKTLDEIIDFFFKIIEKSEVEEDIYHAKDMLELAKKSKFKREPHFLIACALHDFERALPCRIKPTDFRSYEKFKLMHQKRSAEVVRLMLKKLGLREELVERTSELISKHEFGDPKDEEAEELKFLDVLSFFKTNAKFYAKRHSKEELIERMRFGLKRLSKEQLIRLNSILSIDDKYIKDAFEEAKSFHI